VAFHHVSLATKDLPRTHRFYSEVMDFELVRVQMGPTPGGTGWSRLAFYDTGGGGFMSFWDLHDEAIGTGYKTDLSSSVGLPVWTNHLAFDAPSLEDLEAHKQRWREHGITVTEIDWGVTLSIYAVDPNGILVEFVQSRGPFASEADRAEALERLTTGTPQLESSPAPRFYPPLENPTPEQPEMAV
jgi:catechol 2,3-dioxygenase-like lactoylglutathione lyase family enzyme